MSTKYMSVAEAAELLQVDRETVKNYVRRGVFVVSKRKNNMGGYRYSALRSTHSSRRVMMWPSRSGRLSS